MEYKIEVAITEEEIANKVDEIAKKISSDFEGQSLLLVGLLRGSAVFLADIARKINYNKVDLTLDFMNVSSYGNSMQSSREVKILKDLEEDVNNRHILIIEDIVDTGRTLSEVKKMLLMRNPKSLKICTLLDKPERREVEIDVDYIGFKISDFFVVGYGIDYAQKHRTLPFIGQVVEIK
ncbi:hypoxanthine phosphoribosyltransferase [Streptobacillus moniliformis]|uniref:Hypoxanthine phosphoribosyltransferase n=1 Tax=Streptobacillus moniliformis (strain ATCC 14647 / DSM 12112 / NCTC 10651 / 9901) TaxID=519441 RepID=D1AWY7_STRM9|nr:hypoxanthine phosphoribosyltransferase [Streptobacillus moniliformis]ACZ00813.1 hypoxanthine phosphoribosyltransferase [Streptobacillus moniliformis DSM 12112]AVL42791.1 hypoxanthine phosphoribosyltransferase [Streptobacillus moniliformis]QXW65564.1 hypoxanthine phosphoribosyltransferase [Streptobacillus moniliformis]SQA14052.1 Hypoxanthine phosphoribosyltransferase [Streptobacillus moniliformis]